MRPTERIAPLVLVLASACAGQLSPTDDGSGAGGSGQATAFLTIVGDQNLNLDYGFVSALRVKYHDAAGRPLSANVRFRLQGDPQGTLLSAAEDVTDQNGIAQIELTAGDLDAAPFSVQASAADADPTDWRITVGAGGGGQALPRTAVPGVYLVDSQFDIVAGLPGTTGEIVETMIELTDDPNDPASFLLDQVGGTAGDILGAVRPFVDYFLNDRLLYYAPEFVASFVAVGDAFGQVARRFGVVSELDIRETAGGGLEASHTIRGIYWTIDGRKYEYTTEELSLGTLPTQQVPVSYDGSGRVVLGDHELELSYGQLVLFVLNQVIIPNVMPGARSIGDMLARMVDCDGIGFDLADYLGLGILEALLLVEACEDVMGQVGGLIADQIAEIGEGGNALAIHGDCRVSDANNDQRVDNLRNGQWEGEMRFGSLSGPLTRPDQRFTGTPMP